MDVAAHQMTVTIDGTLARSIPVTTGKDGFWTRGGTRVISEMVPETRMDAASTGVAPGDPEYYNLDVRYAMRMTNSTVHPRSTVVGQVRQTPHKVTP